MLVDATSGEVIHSLPNVEFVDNSDEFIWKATPSGCEIFRLGEMETPVDTLAAKNGGYLYPMAVNEQHVVAIERIGMKLNLRILDRDSRVEKEFKFPERTSLHVSPPGHIYLFPRDGTLSKLDPDTGKSHFIATARPYYSLVRAVACGGIPLLLLIASTITLRSAKRMPFFDMGVGCVLIACVFIVWSGVVGSDKRILLTLTQASLGAAVALLLVWVSTSRALYGVAIPVAIVTIAVIFSFYMFAWSEYAGSMFEMVLAAPLLICFQTLGHVLLRRFVGIIRDPHASADTSRQFSVREIAVTTAAVAFLFACLRYVEFGDNRTSQAAPAWMFAFTFTYAVCVVLATWCAFKVQNAFASGIAAIMGSTLLIAMLFAGTTKLTRLNIDSTPYMQPLVAAFVVWWTLRLCRRVGYQLVPR